MCVHHVFFTSWNKLNPDQPRKPLCAADELREAKAMQDDFPTFKVFAERFLKNYVERKCAPRTFQDYSDHINKVFIPVFGDMRIIDILKETATAYGSNCLGMTPRTASQHEYF